MQQSPESVWRTLFSADSLKLWKTWRSNEPIESLAESNSHSEQITRLFRIATILDKHWNWENSSGFLRPEQQLLERLPSGFLRPEQQLLKRLQWTKNMESFDRISHAYQP